MSIFLNWLMHSRIQVMVVVIFLWFVTSSYQNWKRNKLLSQLVKHLKNER